MESQLQKTNNEQDCNAHFHCHESCDQILVENWNKELLPGKGDHKSFRTIADLYIYIHIVSVISSRKFYNIFNWTPPHWLHMACCLLASHSPPHHQRNASGEKPKKTRWSPRTRMLTRMLMVQMSKHMVMQSRTIPFCNSLLEQSCACFPCYQSAVWSGKCRVWSVK